MNCVRFAKAATREAANVTQGRNRRKDLEYWVAGQSETGHG